MRKEGGGWFGLHLILLPPVRLVLFSGNQILKKKEHQKQSDKQGNVGACPHLSQADAIKAAETKIGTRTLLHVSQSTIIDQRQMQS